MDDEGATRPEPITAIVGGLLTYKGCLIAFDPVITHFELSTICIRNGHIILEEAKGEAIFADEDLRRRDDRLDCIGGCLTGLILPRSNLCRRVGNRSATAGRLAACGHDDQACHNQCSTHV